MKRDQWGSGFIAAALAFCISFGGVMAIDTGFRIANTDRTAVALFCIIYAALAAWAFSSRRGDWFLLGGTVLAGLLLWVQRSEITNAVATDTNWYPGPLQEQLTNLVRYIFSFYHKAYGWGSAPTGTSSDDPMGLGLCLVAVPVIWAVCRAVCCKKWALSAVIVGFLPLISCLVVTDTVPETWALMILLPAMVILLLTQTVRRSSARDANRLTAMLLVPVILASSLLFWAVPREEYEPKHEALFQWFETLIGKENGTGTGGNGTLAGTAGPSGALAVNLAGLGPQTAPKTPVMEVVADRSGTLYLRGRAYESYDGKAWSQSEFGSQPDGLWPLRDSDSVGSVEITTRQVHAVLYFPYYAGGELWTDQMTDGAIPNAEGLTGYSFRQYDAGEGGIWEDDGRLLACTQLPDETQAEAKRILDENGISEYGLDETEEIAAAVAGLVKRSARYNRQALRMPAEETDFAIWFLEDAGRGYCVHFATAAAVLLRAAGIPARYVTGYAVEVTAGEITLVTAEKSHAWVEYFDEEVGWCVLEATPGEGGEIPTEPTETTAPEETTQPTQPAETTQPTVPGTSAPTLPSATRPAGTTEPGQTEKPVLNLRWLGRFMQVLGWIAGIVLVLWGQYFLRRRWKEKRMHTGSPNHRALACWREVCLEARLRKVEPPKHLRSLAEKAKYSHHTLSDQELNEFFSWLRGAKRTRRQMQEWYIRLLQKLIWAVE